MPPRGFVELTFLLDLTSNPVPSDEPDSAPFEVMFRANTDNNALSDKTTWALRGSVRRPLSISPNRFSFSGGHRLVAGGSHPTFSAAVLCNAKPEDLDLVAHCDPNIGDCALTMNADGSVRLDFTPAQTLSLGRFTGSIQLQNKSAGHLHDYGEVPVSGEVVGPVSPLPELIYLGACQSKDVHSFDLGLKSLSKRPFRIEKVTFESPDCKAEFDAQLLASHHTVLLRITAGELRSKWESVVIDIRFADNEMTTVQVPILYYGLQKAAKQLQ